MKKTNGNRFYALFCEAFASRRDMLLVQCKMHVTGRGHPLIDLEHSRTLDERRRAHSFDIVEACAITAPDNQDVAKAACCDNPKPGAVHLECGICCDRHTVGNSGDVCRRGFSHPYGV